MLTAPASYRDLVTTVLLSRGIRPGGGSTQAAPPAAVQVYDGGRLVPPTPQQAQLAESFRAANFARHVAQRTGSAPEAVSWWFQE